MEKLQNIAELLLRMAKEAGADEAQCTVSESETREFNVDGGELSLMRTLFDRSVSVTVLKDHRVGSMSVNRFDEAALKTAVAEAVASADSAVPDEAREFAPGPMEQDFTCGVPEPDQETLFTRLQEFLTDVAERHPKLILEQIVTEHVRVRRVYANTNGVLYRTLAGQYGLSTTYSAHDGNDCTSMYGGSASMLDLGARFIDLPLMDREMGDVERQLGAKPVDGKFTGTAVFAPGCLAGDVFGQILQNFVSDTPLIDGTSLWKDKLGQAVADPRISLSLRPLDERIVCGQRYTGEGDPAENFDVIRNGVLESFMLSRYGANKTGRPRAKNTSYAMVVEPGETPLQDIITGIDKGVFLMRFSGGHPSANGEFSGVAKNGFLIENGRLTTPLTETMISGNLAAMLLKLRAVSREVLADGDIVMPYMAFDGVTVSGK